MHYNRIYKDDLVNGEGIRVALFVSGCSHGCDGCYNKSTWNPTSGTEFTLDTIDEILEALAPEHVAGLTLTGGDPLHENNVHSIALLVNIVRGMMPTKNIWMWTGYTKAEVFSDSEQLNEVRQVIWNECDTVIDGRFEKELYSPDLKWRGSSNQIIHVRNV